MSMTEQTPLTKPDCRQRARAGAEPVARGLGRLGLTPNTLTLIGFGIAVVAALSAAAQAWLAAGLLVAFGAAFDLLDGALARATSSTSSLGAFMDSVFDRAGEAVVYIGIAIGCFAADFGFGALLAMTAMGSAMMVSYTRAKSEGLGFTSGSGMASIGLAPREVRTVFVVIGLVLAGLAGGLGAFMFPNEAGTTAIVVSLGLITILATITTIQRIVHVYRQAKKEH
jgi:CDP-diacylglycerol---glycerol-3-phosphate 3-phosphatidyltransferase